MMLALYFICILGHGLAFPAADSGSDSPERDGMRLESEEELNKVMDGKLEVLGDAFRNNEMDPLKVIIAHMPENGPVRRWAMDSVRHKDQVSSYFSDERIAKALPGIVFGDEEISLQLLDAELPNEMVEYNFEQPKEKASVTTKPPGIKPEKDIVYSFPDSPNAELFGLGDIVRNGSVLITRTKAKEQLITCPIVIGPFKLVMLSPDLDNPLHATHVFSGSISGELTFKTTKKSLALTKLRIPRIAAKQTTVFLSKTEKFATRKDELNAARLATHISFELNRLWTKETPLYKQITDAYRNFFNV